MIDLKKLYRAIEDVELERFEGKQSLAAKAVGISEQAYSLNKKRILKGNFTIATIMRFEEAFGVDLLENAKPQKTAE